MRLGNYEIVHSPEGLARIRQLSSGELMHPLAEPLHESVELYVKPSGLLDRLAQPIKDPLVLWDVGLGAATNAMAAILSVECVKKPIRPLELISFENDLDGLRLALSQADQFSHLRNHEAPGMLLEKKLWHSAKLKIRWSGIEGDFLETCRNAPQPEIIFYDPFSPRSDPALWGGDAFRLIARRVLPDAVLVTYGAASHARAALASSGFRWSRAAGLGPKRETTIAVFSPEDQNVTLDGRVDRDAHPVDQQV